MELTFRKEEMMTQIKIVNMAVSNNPYTHTIQSAYIHNS